MPLLPIRFEDELGQLLHHRVSSLEGPSLSSSWDGWGTCCCCRDGSLWAEEGSAASCPRGMSYLAGPLTGGVFAFPHLLCRWWLNLACLFQQLIFIRNNLAWKRIALSEIKWNILLISQTQKKKNQRKRQENKAQQIELRWTILFFLSIFWFYCCTEKSIIFIALHQSFLFIKILVIPSESRFSLLLHWLWLLGKPMKMNSLGEISPWSR